jgi:transposase-like protein
MKVKRNSIEAHRLMFGTEEACNIYLANQKWVNGFICKSCNHTAYVKGRKNLDRRCKACQKNESPTSGTLFHSTKLPLVKVFEIIYRIGVNKKGMSCIEISREYDINPKTATLLKDKIQTAMQSSCLYPLTGEVHVDEFFVGGPEEGKQGRSDDSKKKRAIIAVETRPLKKKNIGRIYIETIANFSTSELRKIFDKHIDKNSYIKTDKWSGYSPLKNEYPNLVQKLSEKGRSMPELHLMIMNLKSWIKGIHHKVSPERFQKYLDEFTYRFNRRNSIESIATNLIDKLCAKNRLIPIYKG